MLCGNIENQKHFMALLLKGTAFDRLLIRNIVLRTSVLYEIDCTLNKDWFDTDEQEELEKYPAWSAMRPTVFELVKGNRLPGYMKLILSPDPAATEKIHKNAAALFINILFENNKLSVTNGCSQKVFSMDRSLEAVWDEYTARFFKQNGILILDI